jgi:hypothetical protein
MSAIRIAKKKYFTVDQANAMLPLLRLILRDITGLAQTLREQHRRLARLQQQPSSGSDAEREAAIAEVEATQEKLREHKHELDQLHVELKDYLTGLVDFPARREGRDVYLCWRLGEPEVGHWHELDTGFAGRQSLEPSSTRRIPQGG